MGSFMGHVQGGLPFVLFGIRWLYSLLMRYFLCRKSASLGNTKTPKFKNDIAYPYSCRPDLPIDGMLIILAMLLDIGAEITGGLLGMYSFVMNGQHIVMKSFFLLLGVLLVLKHYKYLPFKDIEYPFAVIPFVVSALVLYIHTGGKPLVEIHVHVYNSLVDLVIALMLTVEMTHRNSVLVGIFRCIAIITVGTWLLVYASIQYDTLGMKLDQDDPQNLKVVMILFLWNFFGNLILLFQVVLLVIMRVRLMSPPQVYEALRKSYSTDSEQPVHDPEQGKFMLANSDDEDV